MGYAAEVQSSLNGRILPTERSIMTNELSAKMVQTSNDMSFL